MARLRLGQLQEGWGWHCKIESASRELPFTTCREFGRPGTHTKKSDISKTRQILVKLMPFMTCGEDHLGALFGSMHSVTSLGRSSLQRTVAVARP